MGNSFRCRGTIGFVVTLLSIMNIVGCGGDGVNQGTVTGTVTYRGEVVSQGLVNFATKSGFAVSAKLEPNGVYAARSHHGAGIPVGTYQVSVLPVPLSDKDVVQALKGGAITAPSSSVLIDIPEKFRDFGTSGLTVEVQSGNNVFDIELQD